LAVGIGVADSTSRSTSTTAAVVSVSAVLTLPLAFRRRAPLLTGILVVVGVVLLVIADVKVGFVPVPAVGLAAFTAGRELGTSRARAALVITVGWLPLLYVWQHERTHVEDLVIGVSLIAGSWWLGRTLRVRALELEQERARLEQQRADAETHARDEERARIARELHDIVAHSVSVITVQAEGVRRRLHPDQTVEAERLKDIETAARQAMVELRRLFGTLRHDTSPAPLEPQPGLDQLGRLVSRTSDAGLPVELQVTGEARPLAAGVDLAAYRIVQEALTNALRHAGASRARVHVVHGSDAVRIEVADDGRGAQGAVPGRGLIGMQERVALLGGRLSVADAPGGGTLVAATIPTQGGLAA
jgi:signal transduction histidine kinase